MKRVLGLVLSLALAVGCCTGLAGCNVNETIENLEAWAESGTPTPTPTVTKTEDEIKLEKYEEIDAYFVEARDYFDSNMSTHLRRLIAKGDVEGSLQLMEEIIPRFESYAAQLEQYVEEDPDLPEDAVTMCTLMAQGLRKMNDDWLKPALKYYSTGEGTFEANFDKVYSEVSTKYVSDAGAAPRTGFYLVINELKAKIKQDKAGTQQDS